MKLILPILLLVTFSNNIFSQDKEKPFPDDTSQLKDKIKQLNEAVQSINNEVKILRRNNNFQQAKIENLQDSIQKIIEKQKIIHSTSQSNKDSLNFLVEELNKTSSNLNQQIEQIRAKSKEQIGTLNQTVNTKWLYGIIAFLLLALLAVIGYIVLNKKVHNKEQNLEDNIAQTRKDLEEEAIRLDQRLVQTMESQLKLMQEGQYAEGESENGEQEQDHSLALKVADEIVRIEKNLSKMDENTKGLKQLTKAVQRIKDNFAASGYEMVELLNKPYNEGLKVYASFIPDENLESNQSIITRIIKPQVKFQGEMIQPGQVEVSQGLE